METCIFIKCTKTWKNWSFKDWLMLVTWEQHSQALIWTILSAQAPPWQPSSRTEEVFVMSFVQSVQHIQMKLFFSSFGVGFKSEFYLHLYKHNLKSVLYKLYIIACFTIRQFGWYSQIELAGVFTHRIIVCR